jgi:hypothetical protein
MLQTWQLLAIALGFIIYMISVVKILRQPELPLEKETRNEGPLKSLPIFGYQPSPKKAQNVQRSAGRENLVEKLLKMVRRERKNG